MSREATASEHRFLRGLAGSCQNRTPYPFLEPQSARFFYDDRLTVDGGILGSTRATEPTRVCLSPILERSIQLGVNLGQVADTVVHELTHLEQMRHWWFYLCNNPLLRHWTTEAQAYRNGAAARGIVEA